MGMLSSYRKRWQSLNAEGLGWQLLAADRLGGLSAVTKTMRLLLQSMMLAIAAALAVTGAITSGSIIAATIIFGRALAPVEQIIGHWKGFVKARESYRKLEDILSYAPAERARTQLPRPSWPRSGRLHRSDSKDGSSRMTVPRSAPRADLTLRSR